MGRAGWLAGGMLALVAWGTPACDAQDRTALDAPRLELLIDSLLPKIAEASGLAVRRPVSFALQPRSEARAFLVEQLDEEMAELEGMERAYKALGLLPDTLRLRPLMLDLLTEQVVGYYDPRTDRLYVVEGVPLATAGPVVAHELVHALQDQHTSLDSLVLPERGNDRQLAAQSAAEGQAMLVMLALQAAETSGQAIDPGALPDLGPMLRPALESQNDQFPVFQRAPRLLRETLIFPYIGGASFVQALYRARSGGDPLLPRGETPVPFGELLPQSTEQVLDPDGAFLGDRDHPTELALGPATGGWSVAYQNTLGQLEARILMTERAGESAEGAVSGWDGDRYALLDGPAGAVALVWYSVWDDPAAADRFARHYRRWAASAAADRAPGLGPGTAERLQVDGRPVVRVVEATPGTSPSSVGLPALVSLTEDAPD